MAAGGDRIMSEEREFDEISKFAWELGVRAGLDEEFIHPFLQKLSQDREVLEEFAYYAQHNQFADQIKVNGYGIVDVLVWQIDHFKAWLDRDNTQTKENGSAMVLRAFDTFLDMRKCPEKYVRAMESETGTDYSNKY